MWTPKSLGDYSTANFYNSSSRSPPAELFRKDLISAMKLPDNEPLAVDDYWFISDTWKQEWERGVQVPVNPEGLPESAVRIIRKKDRTADFKLSKKLIRSSHDDFFSNDIHELSTSATLAEKVCRYDMDDCDLHWLEAANDKRCQMNLPSIEEDVMEQIMEELESQCYCGMQDAINSEAVLGIEYDEDVICDVCRSPDSEDGNEMVFCDSCDICVHQACYGITSIPDGSWLCRTCSLSIKMPSCVLCPNKGGAMKCTRTGKEWAHVSCALWIPEVSIGCVEKMEPITKIALIPASRWALLCCICRERSGACIQCTVKSCKTAYHVTCGFKSGLQMQAIFEDESEDEGVKLKSYCPKHSKDKESSISSDSEDEITKKGSSHRTKAKISSEEKTNARAKRLKQIESSFFKYVKMDEVGKAASCAIETVQFVYHYWKLKRVAGFNAPLLTPSANENDLLCQGQEDDLYARMKMFVHLRQDLERVRNLCYMVSRREKLSRTWTRMREQIFHKQLSTVTDSTLRLTEAEKRSVVHACHGGSIYDRLSSSDPNCCPSVRRVTPATTKNESSASSTKRSSVGERIPNPYARLYGNLNGIHSRSRRRSGGSLEAKRDDASTKSNEEADLPETESDRLCPAVTIDRRDRFEERQRCSKSATGQHFTRSASLRVGANDDDEPEQSVNVTANGNGSSRFPSGGDDNEQTKSTDPKYLSAKENVETRLDEMRPNAIKTDNDAADSHRRHRHKKSKPRFRNLRSPSERSPPRETTTTPPTATSGSVSGKSVPRSPSIETSPFKDKLRQETAKIHESLFSTSSLKGSLAGYRIPKKARNESESEVTKQLSSVEDASDVPASANIEPEQPPPPSPSELKPSFQQNHWNPGNVVDNNGSPLQLQSSTTVQRWNCNSTRPAPLLPTPPMLPRQPLPQYADRRVTRRDRTMYEPPPTSSSSSISPPLNGGGRDECSRRLVIKLRKDPNYPESHRWRRDGDIVSSNNNNNNNAYDYDCESTPPPPPSSSRHVRLKLDAARFDGHRVVNSDPRLRRSISPSGMMHNNNNNNCRTDPRTFKNRSGHGGNPYSMRSRTSLAEHNNFS